MAKKAKAVEVKNPIKMFMVKWKATGRTQIRARTQKEADEMFKNDDRRLARMEDVISIVVNPREPRPVEEPEDILAPHSSMRDDFEEEDDEDWGDEEEEEDDDDY